MSSFIDQHIIELLQERDERGMKMLYKKYGAALYGSILQMVHDEDLASDILQDSLLKVWEKAHLYQAKKAKLFTWVFQITRNTTIDYLRKNQKKQSKEIRLEKTNVQLEETNSIIEENENLRSKVNDLDDKLKEAIETVFFKGMTHVEAADYLNLPLGTFKSRIRNALIQLRTIIKTVGLLLMINN